MKKFIPTLIILFTLNPTLSLAFGKHFWSGETISLENAKSKWGSEEFNASIFKKNQKNRTKMAVTIVTKKILIGKSIKEVQDLLGDHDGYYFSDQTPAYIIYDGSKSEEDTWQIVCLLDKNSKVEEVIFHKNCCEK